MSLINLDHLNPGKLLKFWLRDLMYDYIYY